MLRFEAGQKIFKIGEVRVGGQPGELPTVLIGNVFYEGMPEVTDHKAGIFHRKSVLKWIQIADELSSKTGIPHFIDIMAMHPEAVEQYIMFISEHTDGVMLIDGTNLATRVAGLKVVDELGLQTRTILNGISPQISNTELEAIRSSGVTAAILIAYNEVDFSPEGRVAVLNGFDEHSGLLEVAEKAGVEKILVDTVVFDIPSVAYAAEAIALVKNELGFPSGCSPANATYDWKRQQDAILRGSFAAYNASAHTIAQFEGADFLIYGPIKQARNTIPTCAMNDAIIAYRARKQLGTQPLNGDHPLYRIL